MRSGKILLLAFLLGLFSHLNSHGQQIDPKTIEKSRKTTDGRFSFLKFNRNVSKYDTSITTIKRILNLGNKHSLRFDNKAIISPDLATRQNKHSRYSQYFEGLKIEFGSLTVHSTSGALEILSGEYYNVPENFSVTPALSEANALLQALSFVGASKYSWQEGGFPERLLNERPKGELVICKDFIAAQANNAAPPAMKLAYKFAIYAVQPLRYDHIYVDASTGRILLVNPIIKHADGTAATKYSGTRTISTSSHSSGGHTLKDTVGNYNIATWNCNKNPNYSNVTEFIDNDNNWTSQEYNNSNLDNAALDAHWGTMKSYEYFRVKHNRNSFDNNGSRMNSYVHFGNGYVNAFWNGTSMTYGDGDGIQYDPLTTIDICGHEIAHAVCQYSANLVYYYESGALNESLSDIWGACIEYFSDPQKQTWLLGDECSLSGIPFRSMSNPNSQGQPDTYKGNLWFTGSSDNGGVHYNSGVMNYWFYLLSVGGSGVNDFGQSFNISGISIDKAASIVYRAETMYLFPSAIYPDARMAMLLAAADLYGANSNEYLQARKAWDAVGVIETLSTPYNFNAVYNGSTAVQLSWAYVNADNISGFAIERSINDTVSFQQIAFIDSNIRNFNDQNFVNDAVNIYRIRAVRGDSVYSTYPNSIRVAVGNAPLIMTGGTFTTCGSIFLDPGGSANYPNSSSVTTTINPATPGTKIRVKFNSFNTEMSNDLLRVYNGVGLNNYLGYYSGNIKPSVVQSTASGGELTFSFITNYQISDSGWNAFISCYKPIDAVSGLTASVVPQIGVSLQWNDLLTDETKFVIERSLNDSLNFQVWRELPANTTSYTDSTLSSSTLAYYRIVAYWDNIGSNYSRSVGSLYGTAVLMQNGSIATCEGLFMDAGGLGNNTAFGIQTLTLRPSVVGKKIKLSFTEINISSYSEFLRIYDGSSTGAPLIGVFNGTSLPPLIESSASNGDLTIQYTGYSNSPGWKAIITCFWPVEAPGGLTTELINSKPTLNWIDRSNDETKFVIERSTNSPRRFQVLGEVPANGTNFVDNTAPSNSLLFYRVKAFRETQGSASSNVVELGLGNAPFLMKDSVLLTCDKVFMDDAGVDMLNEHSVPRTVTFKPSIAGNRVRVEFSSFRISGSYLHVYNGSSTSAALIGSYYYSSIPKIFDGLNTDGALTFQFVNQGTYYDSGWIAKVSCYKPVAQPTELNVAPNGSQLPVLTWNDNADDETNYIIERSTNSTTLFNRIDNISANSTSFIDSLASINNFYIYRVKAQRDTFNSHYTSVARINLGNIPFLMKDSILVVCEKIFMDAGGIDVFPTDYTARTLTIKSSIPGNRIRVKFHKFRSSTSLHVFNGPTAFQSPSLGVFSGSNIDSVFDGSGPDGSLTFYFAAPYNSDSGWLASISCYKPVPKPTGLQSNQIPGNKIQLQWNDNSSDETEFVVERSVNANTLYSRIATLPANTNLYVDSLVPANSVLFYRVKAVRDSINSFYSDTTTKLFGNAPLIMRDTVAVVCGNQFMDPGGVDVAPRVYKTYRATLMPNTPDSRVRVEFKMFKIGNNSTVRVYNGASVNAPLLASANLGTPFPSLLEGVNTDGALTFVYTSSNYEVDSGWLADVICYKTVARPTQSSAVDLGNKKIRISWKDNSNDETKFVVERSENSFERFQAVGQAGANNENYVDTTAPEHTMLYYRVKAYRDTLPSFSSDTSLLTYGEAPFIMSDSTLIVCNRKFYDAGGLDRYPSYYSKKTTFKPSIAGNRIKISFSKVRYFGTIEIFDGPSSNSRLIGAYSSNSLPLSVTTTNLEGSLTLIHYAYNNIDSGWEAQINCFKPVAKPTSLHAFPSATSQLNLRWDDNAEDETKYVVERSINNPYGYVPIAELPANSNSFLDSTLTNDILVFYRVKALRDTLSSYYSDTATYEKGNGPIIMRDNSVVACNKVFLDPAGSGVLTSANMNGWTVIKPGLPNHRIRVVFSKFKVGYGNGLAIFNGPSNYSPRLGFYNDQSPPNSVVSTAVDGSLSFYFGKPNLTNDSGWVAHVYCEEILYAPSELRATRVGNNKARLEWIDGSLNELGFAVERSNDGINFAALVQLESNATVYFDSTDGTIPYHYYRIKAYKGDSSSAYSNTAAVSINNDTVLARNGEFSGCNLTFMDPGGTGLYQNNQSILTRFYPPDKHSRLQISFKSLKLANNYNDRLLIYIGNDLTYPPYRTYYANSTPEILQAADFTGSISIRFISGDNSVDSGWIATISCVPFPAPTDLSATLLDDGKIKLKWTKADSSPIRYHIERSIGSPNRFNIFSGVIEGTSDSVIDNKPASNAVNYYRIQAIYDGYKFSAYSNITHANPTKCATPTGIGTQNYHAIYNVLGATDVMDSTCKLIAKIKPSETTGTSHFTLSSFFWNSPTASNFNSQTFLRKRYEFSYIENPPSGNGTISLFLDQTDFDDFNLQDVYAKLPTSPTDREKIKNLRVWVFGSYSYDQSGTVESFRVNPTEIDSSKVKLFWNYQYNCWQLTIDTRIYGGFFITTSLDSTNICSSSNPTATNSFWTAKNGNSYRWQKYTEAGFVNVNSDANHSGELTPLLHINNYFVGHGDIYRCVVDGVPTKPIQINKIAYWKGGNNGSWTDQNNWYCGVVPHSNSAIVVEAGKLYYPVIYHNVICRSLTIKSGASVTVSSGYNIKIEK